MISTASHSLPMPTALRAALRPAPHALPAQALGASLSLDQARTAAARIDHESLPAFCRSMAPRRLLAFLAGRWCAQTLLERLGFTAAVVRGPGGEPLWPAGCTGSIAHTDRAAYAAVLPGPPTADLGIDSEPWPGDEALQAIREACCSADERVRLFAGRDARLVAAAVFSAKEAYYKAMHRRVGRVVDFTEVEAEAFDGDTLRLAPVRGSALHALVPPVAARLVVRDETVHAAVMLPFPP